MNRIGSWIALVATTVVVGLPMSLCGMGPGSEIYRFELLPVADDNLHLNYGLLPFSRHAKLAGGFTLEMTDGVPVLSNLDVSIYDPVWWDSDGQVLLDPPSYLDPGPVVLGASLLDVFPAGPLRQPLDGTSVSDTRLSFVDRQLIPGTKISYSTTIDLTGDLGSELLFSGLSAAVGVLDSSTVVINSTALRRLPDLNHDGLVTAADIDLLSDQIRTGAFDAAFDLNGDGVLNQLDRENWVSDVAGTAMGDTNLDRQVEFADFLALSSNFGLTGAGWGAGNFDGDNVVDFDDFLALALNFGTDLRPGYGIPADVSAAAVPEPESTTLLCWSLMPILIGLCRRRRARRD